MRNVAIAVAFGALAVSQAALAVGPDDNASSSETPTQVPIPPEDPKCADGMVWDTESEQCLDADSRHIDDSERLEAVREYAYAGQLNIASKVLDEMNDQSADGVLTYRGFLARKSGDIESGIAWYQKALELNPDNLMARSYIGQGYVESGNMERALDQLVEIQKRGGLDSWPERALRLAIDRGEGYSY